MRAAQGHSSEHPSRTQHSGLVPIQQPVAVPCPHKGTPILSSPLDQEGQVSLIQLLSLTILLFFLLSGGPQDHKNLVENLLYTQLRLDQAHVHFKAIHLPAPLSINSTFRHFPGEQKHVAEE